MVLVELWMHVSEQEQLARFGSRRDDPLRSWTLTDEDWRNRDERPQCEAAVGDVLETVCRAVEHGLAARGDDRELPTTG